MNIVVIGASHKTSPLWLREKVALSAVSLFDTRKRLHSCPGVDELLVVATCNRIEFYAVGRGEKICRESVAGFLASEYRLTAEEIDSYFYVKSGLDAVKHLFTVGAGADSMVLGETQVLSQVRQAVDQARQEGILGPELEKLVSHAGRGADRIRQETSFHSHPVSVGSVAVEMAREYLGSLKNRAAMILGAGEMGIITARALSANGIAAILVANRTLSRAQEVAHSLGGLAVDYTELEAQIAKVDILVTSTSAPHILIKQGMIRAIMESRRKQPLFIVDLSVPRNVGPNVGELDCVTLVNVDGLQETAEKNTRERIAELGKVQDIIEEEARRCLQTDGRNKMSLLELALG